MTDTEVNDRQGQDKTSQRPAPEPLQRATLHRPHEAEPEPPPELPSKPRKFNRPDFYVLPYEFCINPPLQPRRCSDPDRLSPFETQVLAAVVSVARIVHAQSIKELAFKAAHEKIVGERETAARFLAKVRAKKQEKDPFGRRRNSRAAAIRQVGSESYREQKRKLRQAGPADSVQVAITSANLLAVAYADRHFGTRLLAALDRLAQAQPLRDKPPLLSGWRQHGRTLLLEVAGAWVDPRLNVRKKAAPLPVASPSTLALFLFASTVAIDRCRRHTMAGAAIPWDVLCRKVCMHPDTRPSRCGAILDRAFDEVNAHLKTLDRAKLGKARIYPPRSYTVHSTENDPHAVRYRFEYIPVNASDEDDNDDEAPVAAAPKTPAAAAPKAAAPRVDPFGEWLADQSLDPDADIPFP